MSTTLKWGIILFGLEDKKYIYWFYLPILMNLYLTKMYRIDNNYQHVHS